MGHKLFNFHDGYRVLQNCKPLIGSCKCNTALKLIGVISKSKKGDIKVQKARELHSLPLKTGNSQMQAAESKKLVNVVFDKGTYYISEPNGDQYVPRDPDLIIDKHCWYIIRFLENKKHRVKVNDVIRFGRVSFKVTELVVTPEEIKEAREILQWAKNNTDF